MPKTLSRPALAAVALLLAGCASVDIDRAVQDTNQAAPSFTEGRAELARTPQQQEARERLARQLLAEPLTMEAAVQLSLANSPGFQALLAQGWADLAAARQASRPPNPVFTFERVRVHDELELGRLLSIGLLELLTLPRRQALARGLEAQAGVQLTGAVVDHVATVRQAWVRAVAAQELLAYAGKVQKAAQASAELARRMQEVGNFSRAQRIRQHAFYADATAQLASAQHAATAEREALVRALGLTDDQAAQLRLPARLPDLPAQPRPAAQLEAAAQEQRLDWQLARLQLEQAGRAQGLGLLESLVDVEVGARRDTLFDNATGERATARGYELAIRLPLFDWGAARRGELNAQSLLAARRYEDVVRTASSQLRESYSAYRTAYNVARHYRDEIVPLRKALSDENLLRYNGMFIGVFELLADTREQIASVMAAIQAQQQFWLADAGLSAALIGKPVAAQPAAASGTGTPSQANPAH